MKTILQLVGVGILVKLVLLLLVLGCARNRPKLWNDPAAWLDYRTWRGNRTQSQ